MRFCIIKFAGTSHLYPLREAGVDDKRLRSRLDNPRAFRVANIEFFISLRPAFLRGSASASTRPLWNDATLRQKPVKSVQVIFSLRCHSQGLFVRPAGRCSGWMLAGRQSSRWRQRAARAGFHIDTSRYNNRGGTNSICPQYPKCHFVHSMEGGGGGWL